ncbi:type II toxin-antitoxin system Phd/YefM family antitoxin [Vibrio nomapromontoriensis]|uniref:type II toxin-antitoxin system Phd/YefM family antitoxin n=1 Tax=Vibrio nomapromontoriensis TaxID=2910246 RepID=UPI003D0A3BCC
MIVNFTDFRTNLKSIFERTAKDSKPTVVSRKGAENMVLMSESDFNGWQETIHLMSSTNNASRLMESIAQAERGEAKEREVDLG